MTELLTAAQMRAIEEAAIASGEVTGLELMERAGRGVVEAVFEEWPELAQAPHRAVVLCGPGNNGGDGFVVARRLRDKGWSVEVFFYGDVEKLSADARKNHDVWASMGDIADLTHDAVKGGLRPTLLIDAMFGTGATRALPLDLAKAHAAIERRDVGDMHPWLKPYHRVAVDCPSGLDCDSGKVLAPELDNPNEADDVYWRYWTDEVSPRILRTDLTCVFYRRKVGLCLNTLCGKIKVIDIGLGSEDQHPAHLLGPRPDDRAILLDFKTPSGRSRRIWPGSLLHKRASGGANKFDHGHALVLTGGPGKTGAARLAARGALRIGAGLVTLGVPGAAQMEVAGQVTSIMLKRAGTEEEVASVLEDTRINVLCLGPGLGLTRARGLVEKVLSGVEPRPTVLDADALSAFEAVPEALFERLHGKCVLTPHGGEFARLFPDIAEKLNAVPTKGPAYSKVDATREAAKRAGCVVLFKGPNTVIAAPDGRCSINSAQYERSAPWLATAGSGDVLAGFITGLLARGFDPMQAAETAAWLHVECARAFGPGLIAEDLPEALPGVLRELGV